MSPLYWAVRVCVPAVKVATVSIAGPLAGNITGEPIAVLPSKKVTKPLGAGKPGGKDPVPAVDTMELSVMACPKAAERVEELKVVVVEFLLTVCVTELEPLAA